MLVHIPKIETKPQLTIADLEPGDFARINYNSVKNGWESHIVHVFRNTSSNGVSMISLNKPEGLWTNIQDIEPSNCHMIRVLRIYESGDKFEIE